MGNHSTPTFTGLADLASARTGGRAVATNDEFFAPKANLIKPGPAVWIPDKYTSKGTGLTIRLLQLIPSLINVSQSQALARVLRKDRINFVRRQQTIPLDNVLIDREAG